MDRAYSILTVKAVQDGDERVIEGIASTPSPDRMGDVVEPMGAKFALPLPLLWQHNHDEPVGFVDFAKPEAKGIPFRARLAKVDEPGALKDLVDKAWQSVKAGLVRGVSIGFSAKDFDRMKDGGLRFKNWEWLELSLVTIPANAEATISAIKSISREQIAASGDGENVPGASGPVKLSTRGAPTMALAEQIASLEAKRAANAARMEAIQKAAIDRGETKSAEEREEFDTLNSEIGTIDDELADMRSLERVKMAGAKPVAGANSADHESRNPGTVPAQVRLSENLEKGVAFARIAKVKALARLDGESAREIAKNYYGEASSVYGHFVRAAVPAANTGDPAWAGNLIAEGGAFADFVEYLRPQTIVGKFGTGNVPSFRRIPFDTPVLIQETGGEGYWVGEGKAKPLTQWTTSRTIMGPLKVANIAPVTEEMLRRSAIDADIWIRDELARALRARIDRTFIDPTAAAVAGVSPASITNGVTAIISSGTTADDIRADMLALSAAYRAANNSTSGTVWIMPEGIAEALAMMTNPLGQPEFSGVTANGGTFLGKPVITSEYVPTAYDPDGAGAATAGAIVVLVKAQDIFFADEGGVQVDFSREASLEMADNPAHDSTTPTGATSMVSMFQTNSVAFRAERTLNWMKRRPESVAVLASVAWGS